MEDESVYVVTSERHYGGPRIRAYTRREDALNQIKVFESEGLKCQLMATTVRRAFVSENQKEDSPKQSDRAVEKETIYAAVSCDYEGEVRLFADKGTAKAWARKYAGQVITETVNREGAARGPDVSKQECARY